MDLVTPTVGKYAVKPLVKGGAITLAAKFVGRYKPEYGTALVKSPVKVLGLYTLGPTAMTMAITTGAAYVVEAMTPDPHKECRGWKEYLQAEANADFLMAAAGSGAIILLQWGKVSNINWKNALISIPLGGAAGNIAYKKVVKPAIVKKGRARAYRLDSRTPTAVLDWGKKVASNAQWITGLVESNLENDLEQSETIAMEDAGWSS